MERPLRKSQPRRREQSGAGLVEVMVASLIVTLVAVGLIGFFAQGRVWIDHEERKRTATLLAQEALEHTMTVDYDAISPWSSTRDIDSVAYSVIVTVAEDTPETSVKTISSTASWQATQSARRSVTLVTMKFDDD